MSDLALKYPVIASSADRTKVGATASGVAALSVPAIIYIVDVLFDIRLTELEVVELINLGLLAYGSIIATFGLLRKIYYQLLPIIDRIRTRN
jgi:hypothetical protein